MISSYFQSLDEHIDLVRQVLTSFNTDGVTPKLKKHKCFTNGIAYLGHVIKLGCLAVSSHTNDKIRDLQTPSKLHSYALSLGCATSSAGLY